MTASLAPIDKNRLAALIEKGKSDPTQVRTVKCRTVTEARFRQLNFVRTLPAHVIDEPPQLLGDDTAPNPSEALLAALGSCIAVGIQALQEHLQHHPAIEHLLGILLPFRRAGGRHHHNIHIAVQRKRRIGR